MCAWRRSLKIFGQVSKVMNYLTAENEYRYIFLTLTVKNVAGDALADELDGMFRAFKNMTARKEFKRIAKGWFRCLEVTHKWERNDYHPHFHAVIAVNKSYFTEASMYLSQKDWAALWQSCMGIDYEPVVDVRSVQPKQGTSNDYSKAVAEVAKYAVKSGDYIKRDEYSDVIIEDSTDEAVEILDDALHNRRLVAFGGCFKDAHKLLNLDDIEKGDLVNTDNDELRTDLSYVVVTYGWSVGLGTYRRKKGIFVE